ncbi:MAG: cell division protein FtsZ [Flavobacteriaceae bacterium]|nr:MAG: cell division protein FtsZ [Flavobacteriaceae bacterium]
MNTTKETGNFIFDLPKNRSASIKVIGVGGGGSNAVNYMYEEGITGVDFVISNTDAQALNNSPIPNKIQLGLSITEGLGAGANPEVGEQAALESLEDVKALLDSNTKMVFITAGMGGGTGTGAAPIIAGIAKEMGILTVAIVTVPFQFEGKMRIEQAEKGLEKLRNSVDSLIIINNNKLRELYGNLGYKTGFAKADEVLATAAKGIAEVITHHYTQNIDLRDARTVLANSGTAIMGSAKAEGENKAKEAISLALDSPLLNDNKITGAKNVLLLIVSGEEEITMDEIGIINDFIQAEAGHNANIIMGVGEDLSLGKQINVTIVATGFPVDDKRYTGQEEKKIFHTLGEEQALVQSLHVEEKTKPEISETQQITRFVLEEEPEKPKEIVSSTEEEPEISLIQEEQISERKHQSNDAFDLFAPIEKKTESSQGIQNKVETFYLDEEFEETQEDFTTTSLFEDLSLRNKKESQDFSSSKYSNSQESMEFGFESQETQNFSEQNSFEESMSFEMEFSSPNLEVEKTNVEVLPEKQSIQQTFLEEKDIVHQPIISRLEERKNKLKQFNFKFQNNYSEQDLENIPAYKRQGINLHQSGQEEKGKIMLSLDQNNEIQIRPNHFLHDNVD